MLSQRIDPNQIDRPMCDDAQADTVYAHDAIDPQRTCHPRQPMSAIGILTQDWAVTYGWSDHAIGRRRSVPSSRQAIVSPPDESTYPDGPFCPRRECWPRSG